MAQAADQGVLLVSVGTIAQLGETALSAQEGRPCSMCALLHNVLSLSELHMSLCLTGTIVVPRSQDPANSA